MASRKKIACAVLLLSLASCPALVLPPDTPPGPATSGEEPSVAVETPQTPAPANPSSTSSPQSNALAKSTPTIFPGHTKIFTEADGGTTVCDDLLDNPISLPPPGHSEDNCSLPRYGLGFFNDNDPPSNFVKAGANTSVTSLIPAHARSAVYNDFVVGGSGGVPIGAQIAVTFDFVGKIFGASVYRDDLSLSLWVKDLTNGQPVGAVDLREQGRDGDQGVTDVAGTAEIVPIGGVSNGLGVTLLRGHTYRVYFQLDAENFGIGSAHGQAQWSKLVVTVDALGDCEPASQHRKQQGCDGIDNDCDGQIDECDEDVFGPDLFVEPEIRGKCFPSESDALAAILSATKAADDCGKITLTPELSGPSCDVEGSITATDDCGNATTVSGLKMRIDGEAPAVSCSTSITSLWPANGSFVNAGFTCSAVDNCSGDLQIDVKVTTDESTTLAPSNGQASAFPDAVLLKSFDGAIVGILLRAERDGGGDGRVYVIHVSATDKCGNVGRASTTVSVPPTGSGQAVDSGQYFDAAGAN